MAGAIELFSGGKSRRAGTHNGDFLAGALRGRERLDPAFFPAFVDNRALNVLDRDGWLVDAEDARTFAGRRADAAGELRKVIRLVQTLERFFPLSFVNEIVPLGDEIVNRAARSHAREQFARVAERHAAIHATGALLLELRLRHVLVELVPMCDALEFRLVRRQLALELHESCWFAHTF